MAHSPSAGIVQYSKYNLAAGRRGTNRQGPDQRRNRQVEFGPRDFTGLPTLQKLANQVGELDWKEL